MVVHRLGDALAISNSEGESGGERQLAGEVVWKENTLSGDGGWECEGGLVDVYVV